MLHWLKNVLGPARGDDALALGRRGEAALAQGRPADAIPHLTRAIDLDGGNPMLHRSLALARSALGDLEGAASAYRTLLALEPGDLRTQVKLGTLYTKLGRLDEATRLLEHAVGVAPGNAEVHLRLGDLLLDRLDPARALAAYREAVRLAPSSGRALVALGRALETVGDVEGGLEAYEQALRAEPESVEAHVSRATAWLAREDYARGWDEYEWRRRAQPDLQGRFPVPDWTGEPLEGRTLLVHAEQGLGDQIMYASCLPQLTSMARRCVVECEPRLAPLFARSFPDARVRGATHLEPGDWIRALGVDVKVAAASAPRFLRRSAEEFPRHEGYLKADPSKIARWRERLSKLGGVRKIGLSWRGGVQRTGRAWRSLALDALLPVTSTPGAAFVSLQYDANAAELAGFAERHGIVVHHWPEVLEDYDETAALVCALDLTISVCTAVIHLAGALGRPAWVLTPVKPEARYGLEGSSMRWYPSVRLFRQRTLGDWSPVVEQVARELAA